MLVRLNEGPLTPKNHVGGGTCKRISASQGKLGSEEDIPSPVPVPLPLGPTKYLHSNFRTLQMFINPPSLVVNVTTVTLSRLHANVVFVYFNSTR